MAYINDKKILNIELTTLNLSDEDKTEIAAMLNEVDQTFNPASENAQSGKAVAEAISNIVEQMPTEIKPYIDNLFDENIVSALESDY